jgi:hypothetical protein
MSLASDVFALRVSLDSQLIESEYRPIFQKFNNLIEIIKFKFA